MVDIQKRIDDPAVCRPERSGYRGWESLLGIVVATGLAMVSALYEAGLCASYLFSVRSPLALLLALVVNPALVWFAETVTGRRASGIAPAVAWCLVWMAALSQRTEGDLVVAGDNWVGMATTLVGPVAFGVALYATILIRPSLSRAAGSLKQPTR